MTAPKIQKVLILKNEQGQYDKAEIQFSTPIDDSTVVPKDFTFISINSWTYPGILFDTNVTSAQQVNDEYITIIFNPKPSVSEVKYFEGSLKSATGINFESQVITPILQP